jgi:adenylate kinase family enzyme
VDVARLCRVGRGRRGRLNICEPEIVCSGEEANRSIRATSLGQRDAGRVDTKAAWHSIHVDWSYPSSGGQEQDTDRSRGGQNDPCPNCGGTLEARSDDNANALAHRMREYLDKTVPVTDFYYRRGIFAAVDASRERELVFSDVSKLIHA